jgi:peptidoglycan/xylan/chitin deacetylase (PgdA/CDA1 family)
VSRFHKLTAATLPFAALGLAVNSLTLFFFVLIGFLTVIGLGVAFPQLRLFGPFICAGNPSRKWVALTFDDGPDTRSTPALLDLLREAKVEAAFFCIGHRVTANPELAARIVREGHLLENHSYGHSNATNFFRVSTLRRDLTQAQQAIQNATGSVPGYFRPPMGLSNPRTFRVARRLGLKVIGWTARGLDTVSTKPERIVARIKHGLRPGAIILLHDGNIPPERLLITVKTLLDTLRALGYEVVRLDRILA